MFIDVRPILGDHAAYYDGYDPKLKELDNRADLKEVFCVIFGELTAMRRHETPEHPHGMAIDGAVEKVFLFDREECKSVPVDLKSRRADFRRQRQRWRKSSGPIRRASSL